MTPVVAATWRSLGEPLLTGHMTQCMSLADDDGGSLTSNPIFVHLGVTAKARLPISQPIGSDIRIKSSQKGIAGCNRQLDRCWMRKHLVVGRCPLVL